jgi:hypothetical protein
MSSLTERKKALTFALLALGVAAVASAMLTPHVAFASGDDNNDDHGHHHHDYNDDNNCDDEDED